MTELRKDPITGTWVILAEERGKRPAPPEKYESIITKGGFCPFCEGNEKKTPPENFALRVKGSSPNSPGWRIRVVSNKYPALTTNGELNPRGEGIYDKMNGIGLHEVIIEAPIHATRITHLSWDYIPDILEVYKNRLFNASKDPRYRYGLIFKNTGISAGATIEHNHSQLIATPVIPITIAQEMAGAKKFFDYRGRCIYCDILYQELENKKRIIIDGKSFVALAPFASRFPFETWILPKKHCSHFTSIKEEELLEMAKVLYDVLKKLDISLEEPPYNYVIHTAPFSENEIAYYHWHLEILPRTARLAGFEFGTGFHINSVPPETAAEEMRSIEI